jgi:NAD(P)-dependent dehydrogenase (short-subunit alcohol dehydrogenase family)
MELPGFRLDGKVAVITGASGDLGALAARAFFEAGASVVATARNVGKCEQLAQRLDPTGRRVVAVQADVTDAGDMAALAERARRVFGGVDILFNNAGVTSPRTFLESTEEEWLRVVDTNIRGTFRCTRAIAPMMIERGGGRIINMGSILSKVGMANRSAYVTSKSAIAHLTQSLAFEFGPFGITVNAIGPTVIVTGLNRDLIASQPALYNGVLKRSALGRLGQPEDLAGALVFLASPASAFITGQTLYIDGGYTAG